MRWFSALFIALMASPVSAVECRDVAYEGASYTVCEVDTAREVLRLFLKDPETDAPLGSFTNVDALLEPQGMRLDFAMNAGMYHQDRAPVGQYVEGGQEVSRVVSSAGPGNFGLLPNGVFCIREGRADVVETLRYLREKPGCDYATQSGPMLVIDGALHPKFLKSSDSRYVRNGVGTSADGHRAVFVISNEPVTFYQFGTFFRDFLKVPQALYFDGNISRLYAPGLERFDGGFPMGPMVGVVRGAGE
ncbi:Predicted periplasmic protein [hydrothermal vent metagenome]|uniref:Predicted periplasmic protein n=1 Tax=hydrothermal vent metagenome TaxID=652676 RepID=A0A3B0SHR3_9ZZZZ